MEQLNAFTVFGGVVFVAVYLWEVAYERRWVNVHPDDACPEWTDRWALLGLHVTLVLAFAYAVALGCWAADFDLGAFA